MLLIVIWDATPNTPLFDFKNEIEKYRKFNPYDIKIKRVNACIKNGGQGLTLTELINDFRANNNIKEKITEFNLLVERVEKIKDKDGNLLTSFF